MYPEINNVNAILTGSMSTRVISVYVITWMSLHNSYTLGLRCWVCSSIYNSKCSEPFELKNQYSDSNYIESNCSTCAKMHVSQETNCDDEGDCDTEHAIYRSCIKGKTETNRCSTGHLLHIYGRECFCQTDLCNTGSQVTERNISANIIALFALLFML